MSENVSPLYPQTRSGLRVSVVVPTCRRNDLLRRCLVALIEQNLPAQEYEIIVVDDARSDETRAFVLGFSRDHAGAASIFYQRPAADTRGPAAARNAGWHAAAADIIAFTDDDTIPGRHWLSEGLRVMEQEVAAAAWGHVEVPLPQAPTDAERNTGGLHGAEFITANCFVRRHALAAVGGFDERFTRPWREDSDLYFTLLERGWKVVRAPSALVVHPPRQAPATACLSQHRNLLYDALLYKKHPRLYREKIAAGPPLRYYVIVVAFFAFVLAALAGHPRFGMAAMAIWLGLTAHLAWRRLQGISRAWRDVAGIVLTSLPIPFLAVYWRLAGSLRYRVAFA